MTERYAILTESSCDLTPEMAADAGLEIVPLTFTMEGKTYAHYLDGREYPVDRFYQRMREGATAVTAAANVAELEQAMEEHLKVGEDVLFLCFSSGLSSTCNSCAIAAAELRERYPQRKIFTVDTLAACGGQGLLVYLVGRRRLAGATIEEARDYTQSIKLHLAHWFTVDDLVYLKRGGRISPTVAAVGTMLNIKPVLHVDDEGHLIPQEKVRGRKAAIQALLRHMEETVVHPEDQTVLVSHSDCPADAQTLRDMVEERFHPAQVLISELGPIIGTHTGPGMVSLFFLATHR
jgi:DegV family protein with EDD domain